jgi:two-component system CheB/CheR fusion protein
MHDAHSLPAGITPTTGVGIVGLGASAGGLEPLEQFLSNIPTATGLAYMVVQHMDPTHKTLLGELLQRATWMPVHEAVNAKLIEPDAVYVIPPDSELTVMSGVVLSGMGSDGTLKGEFTAQLVRSTACRACGVGTR